MISINMNSIKSYIKRLQMACCDVKPFFRIAHLAMLIVCIVLLVIATFCFFVALNPDVKWNEYYAEVYPQTGLYAFYYNTLWDSTDMHQFEGKTGTGNFIPILNLFRDESWKEPSQRYLKIAVGLNLGSTFFLVLTLILKATTHHKLFVLIPKGLSSATGIIAGSLTIKSVLDYQHEIIDGILPSAKKPIEWGGYYLPENEVMKLGFNLAQYGGAITLATSIIVFISGVLYLIYGDGKVFRKREGHFYPSQIPKDTTGTIKEEYTTNKDPTDTIKVKYIHHKDDESLATVAPY